MSPAMKAIRKGFCICALAAAGLWALSSDAYVRTTTATTKTPIRWKETSSVKIRVNSRGSDDVKDGSDVVAVKQSMMNWVQATQHCSYISFNVLSDSPDAKIFFDRSNYDDNENVVVWTEDKWDHNIDALAITTLYFVEKQGDSRDGELLDADIELNGVNHSFSTTGAKDKTDIENTVTHELGHLLGLDHTCDDGTYTETPKDHNGDDIPTCTPPMPMWILNSTMYAYADNGETKKRSPEADDIMGICAIYPIDADPGGCSLSHGQEPGWQGLVVLLLVLACIRAQVAKPLRGSHRSVVSKF